MTFAIIKSSNAHGVLRGLIFAALGLAGCGPGTGSSDDSADSTGAAGTTSAAGTTGAGTTTNEPTTSGTGSASASASATGTDAGETTSGAHSTGVESESEGPLMCGLMDCVDPVELMQSDGKTPSGLVRCASGLVHRAASVACVAPQLATNCLEPIDGSECTEDADCVEDGFGTCMEAFACGFTAGFCGCVYGCETDVDCDPGEVCLCAGEGSARSQCVPAGCTTDQECGGHACAASTDPFDAPQILAFACHADDDACCSNADCELGAECRFGTLTPDAWGCDFGGDCGRPLRVAGQVEVAAATRRGDWLAGIGVVRLPDADTRAALAEHWRRVGLAEHASVGSFARFILQLVAVGAPAELVAAAQQALADEVEHARVGFALASAYAGEAVGPGPLPAACGALATSLEEVVRAVIEEACVGETLSALEVAEAAARAEDPAVAGLLARVAEDEGRHAALGWRFVAWAVRAAPGLGDAVAGWFAAAIRAAGARAAAWTGDTALRRHGVVDPGLRADVVQAGLQAVIRPSAAALRAA